MRAGQRLAGERWRYARGTRKEDDRIRNKSSPSVGSVSGRAEGLVKTRIVDVMAKGGSEIRNGTTWKFNIEMVCTCVVPKFHLPGMNS